VRILYDGQIYANQPAGGINRYFANLISGLPQNFNPILTTYQSHSVNYPEHPNLKIFSLKQIPPRRIYYKLAKYYFRTVTNSQQFDLTHPTYYSLLTQQEINNKLSPVVITVWDMIHEIFAEQIDPKGYEAEQKKKAIAAAEAVICISKNTKNDLLERYPVPEAKVYVTYLASEIDINMSYGSELVPLQPYYLYVGSRAAKYKNFEGLLKAFSKVVSVYPDVKLCVVGPPFNTDEKKLIASFKLASYLQHYGYVDDYHLAKLYRCSMAFVYPSFYEGFGIPLLEAMSCGAAVIASNCASIPEVVGEAGLLFDPTILDELIDSLLFVLNHALERDRLIYKGQQRAKSFSWNETVSQTINIYHSVAQ
jgi:glycosyltransferase involved in cell wall biosynthesis